jgi:hypothetical protein
MCDISPVLAVSVYSKLASLLLCRSSADRIGQFWNVDHETVEARLCDSPAIQDAHSQHLQTLACQGLPFLELIQVPSDARGQHSLHRHDMLAEQ